ncbi:nickel pincer cofactor biosynthesis protein LarC [Natrarchaeobius sp. A-rgal3]|uniref:nickel pincer cofactor biosynthesis protein LarC n=1 Tax=Natrarchaeobius versutus TaxID=1679078 RepID=UPI00350F40F4
MRVLAFDGRMGASGDMVLAALLDAGADPDALEPVTDALEVEYRIDETVKCGIASTSVDVFLTGEAAARDASGADNGDGTGGGHAGTDGHDHGPDSPHGHSHDHGDSCHEHTHADSGDHHVHAEGHGPHRSYLEVREIVEGMDLPSAVERNALATFELLGEAEASVHGTDITEIHFHEVGADDAIADVVGASLLLADLEADRIVTTPLSTGGASVSMSHGEYPVPTPAVVEIAERADWSLRGGPVDAELLTPTGAAILGHVADGVDSLPSLSLEESGYGAGGYDLDPHPNVLRVLLGDGSGGLLRDEITVLETNVDDVTPEVLGGLQGTLSDAGARDVTVVPTTMKKSRPGHLVKVICKPEDSSRVARALAAETGTLGIRETGTSHRWIAHRSFETATLEVDGETYDVSVKIASDDHGMVYDVSAEYDDAAAVAEECGLSTREVIRRAESNLRMSIDTESITGRHSPN